MSEATAKAEKAWRDLFNWHLRREIRAELEKREDPDATD